MLKQRFQPFGIDYFGIVVEEEEVFAACVLCSKIVKSGVVEFLVVGNHFMPGVSKVLGGCRLAAAIVNNNDLVIVESGLLFNAVDAIFQQIYLVSSRNNNAYFCACADWATNSKGSLD